MQHVTCIELVNL